MIVLGVIIAVLSVMIFIAGIVALVRPIPRIGLGNRWRAGGAVLAGCLLSVAATSFLPPVEVPTTVSSQPHAEVAPAVEKAVGPTSVVPAKISDGDIETANDATIESVQLLPCPDPDPFRQCEFDQVKAPEYLAEAMKGDYQAQRNVSAMHTSVRPWNVARPIQGCAWRMVIMVSRPAEATYDDAGMYGIQCAPLSARDKAASEAVAQAIYRRIHGSDLPPLPPIPPHV